MATTLFTPLKVGKMTLAHRIIMAPLTRFRADTDSVHHEIAAEYYAQRANPGGFQIAEATFVSEATGGLLHMPGIYTPAQIDGWRRVTDAVHAKRGYIFLQLFASGRVADPRVLKAKGHRFLAAGDIPMEEGGEAPMPMTKEDIYETVDAFGQAAKNAVFRAGFDGVEIHANNGCLIDQFLQTKSNNRQDEFGGSIGNRARFPLLITEAVTSAIGEERTGLRLSPWSTFFSMRMPDPIPTFAHVIKTIRDRFPRFAYMHLTESRITGDEDSENGTESLDFARAIWQEKGERPFLVAGGHTPKTAAEVVERHGGAVAFGRYFIANPDLPVSQSA
ncbi:hypothetical protein FRB99_003778 [Tulasnella sp. 403]|nr:hypothetical protein FRB99_003778 [Tulasnella sp. 403]